MQHLFLVVLRHPASALRRAPALTRYVVQADTQQAARAALDLAHPGVIGPKTLVSVMRSDSPVIQLH